MCVPLKVEENYSGGGIPETLREAAVLVQAKSLIISRLCISVTQLQWQWGVALGWYESGLRPESRAPHPTVYRPKQVQKEYIRTDIEKALNSHEIAGFDEFCLAPFQRARLICCFTRALGAW